MAPAGDDSGDEGQAGAPPATPQLGVWATAPAPTVFKDVRLRIRRLETEAAGEHPHVPKHGPISRSFCAVRLEYLEPIVRDEALEFFLGETTGHSRQLRCGDAPWLPPSSSSAVSVPRWVTEALLALGRGTAAEFEPVSAVSEDAGGLLGRCRLTLLETGPAMDLLGDGGVLLRTLEAGTGAKPRDLARVSASWHVWFARNSESVLAVGALAEGSGYPNGRELTIDEGQLVIAVELALKEMTAGTHACVRIAEEWGLGPLSPEGNPSLHGAAIWVELLLHTVSNEPAPGEHASASAALEFALSKKQQGNASLAKADAGRALRRYEVGIQTLEAEYRSAAVDEALLALRLNAAQAELKSCRWRAAEVRCSDVLLCDASNVKALFRRGLARAELGELAAAVEDLRAAASGAGGDAVARRELQRVEALRKERLAEERGAYSGVFERMRKQDLAREHREEARRKADQEREAEQKRKAARQQREEARRRQVEAAEATAKLEQASTPEAPVELQQPPAAEGLAELQQQASAVEASARKDAAAEVPTHNGPAADLPAPAAEVAATEASFAEAAPRTDQQLLESMSSDGPGVRPLMPPPNFAPRTVQKAPPVEYEVPAFLQRGRPKKRATG